MVTGIDALKKLITHPDTEHIFYRFDLYLYPRVFADSRRNILSRQRRRVFSGGVFVYPHLPRPGGIFPDNELVIVLGAGHPELDAAFYTELILSERGEKFAYPYLGPDDTVAKNGSFDCLLDICRGNAFVNHSRGGPRILFYKRQVVLRGRFVDIARDYDRAVEYPYLPCPDDRPRVLAFQDKLAVHPCHETAAFRDYPEASPCVFPDQGSYISRGTQCARVRAAFELVYPRLPLARGRIFLYNKRVMILRSLRACHPEFYAGLGVRVCFLIHPPRDAALYHESRVYHAVREIAYA